MENSIADIELAREGHTARLDDPKYAAPALSTPALFAVSSATKVAFLVGLLVYFLTKDAKLTLMVILAQMILASILK
jgi:hypothetical protein